MNKTVQLSLLTIICFTFLGLRFENNNDLCRVNKVLGKPVFWNCEPVGEYDVAFTFQNLINNMNCLGPSQVNAASIENANYESGLQSRLYDAVIIQDGSSRDLAIIFKDKSKETTLGRVKKRSGKLVFIESEPVNNYDIVEQYNVNMKGRQLFTGDCAPHAEKIDKLLKQAFKTESKGKEFDGVIYATQHKDLSIRFE